MNEQADQKNHEKHLAEEEEDRRAYVGQYSNTANFPFEIGDTVWVVKPELRAPLGEFIITAAREGDKFELKWKSNNNPYDTLVEGKSLKRDPYGVGP